MLTHRYERRGAMLVAAGLVLLGLGTSQAQTTPPNPALPYVSPYGSAGPRDPFYAPFWNGYPRHYYSYSVSNLLPTYLTSINYPRIYGAYSYGMAPGAYTEGAMLSPYAVSPSGLRPVYPPSVATVFSTPLVEPVPEYHTAHLTVHVPIDAELWFENVRTLQTGTARRFVSPPLLPGRSYVYDVRAVWTENGKEIAQNRRVRVSGGQQLSIDFIRPGSAEEGATLRTRPLP